MTWPTLWRLPPVVLLLASWVLYAALPGADVPRSDSEAGEMLLSSVESAQIMQDGRELLIRFRVSDAEGRFRMLARQPDGRVAALYHLASASVLKLLVSDRQVYYDEFLHRSDSLRSVLSSVADSRWRTYLSAESSFQRALVYSKQGRYLRAALAGRSAFRDYRRVLDEDPAFYDAYKGMGLLEVAVGSLPSFYRTFLGILGMSGSVSDGIGMLEVAADSSRYSREEALVFLSLIDIVVGIERDAGTMLRSLYVANPDSPLLAHLYGFYLYSSRRAAEAEEVLRPVAERGEDTDYFYVDYVDYYLGDVLFRQGRYQEAIVFYQKYLDRHAGPALKALASLGMGMALEVIGHRMAAESFYAHVREAREFDSDRAARRRAEFLLGQPMTATYRTLLEARNAYNSGRYTEAAAMLEALSSDEQLSVESRAEAAYRLGRTYHAIGDTQKALLAYGSAVTLRGEENSRWAPWSEYYIGTINEDRANHVRARQAYRRAAGYPGNFDYRQALEKNVKVALDRLSTASRE